MPLVLMVVWIALPGREERVAEILRTMVRSTRLEAGCVQYEAHRSVDDPRRFMLYEVYRDEAALKAHEDSEHFRRYVIGEGLGLLESRERAFYRAL